MTYPPVTQFETRALEAARLAAEDRRSVRRQRHGGVLRRLAGWPVPPRPQSQPVECRQ